MKLALSERNGFSTRSRPKLPVERAVLDRFGDEIANDLALGRKQRRKTGPARCRLGKIGGHEAIEKLAAVGAGHFDDTAVRKKRCFHGQVLARYRQET